MTKPPLIIHLAAPRGFCAGVERAIEIVERALEIHGPPVYVRHEIVHNKHVVESLRAKGAVFVEEVSDVPDGAVTIFSAHGVAEKVEIEANDRNLPVIDATCPLVSKVHKEGQNHAQKGREVILIGHAGHPEVEGTQGRIPGGVHLVQTPEDVAHLRVKDPKALSYVTQTTLSVDETRDTINALKNRFPAIVGPDVKDICYATQNRQNAVKTAAGAADLVLIIGADNSSNSNRLREVATAGGTPAYRIQSAAELQTDWFHGIDKVGISAGASTPEILVEEVIEVLKKEFNAEVETLPGKEEKIHFRLPREMER
jgi:4-hydroxy-3-methylbut-2-enyl diphosphate reductase